MGNFSLSTTKFEEKRTLNYLVNIISSPICDFAGDKIMDIAADALDRRAISRLVRKHFPGIARTKAFSNWSHGAARYNPVMGPRAAMLLRQHILPMTVDRLSALSGRSDGQIRKRLKSLTRTFNLCDADEKTVEFFFLCKKSALIREHFKDPSGLFNMGDTLMFNEFGDVILGLPRLKFLSAMRKKMLVETSIIELSPYMELAQWCVDYLSGLGNADLGSELFTLENDETLKLTDFTVSSDELRVLNGLMKKAKGLNILLYGAAGTGKTSFVRSLAIHYRKRLFSVKVSEDDDIKTRLRAIYGAVNAAGQRDSLILIDEADDVLNTNRSFGRSSAVSKSWINSFLDGNGRAIFWITNRSGGIDPSTMRRFSFTLEFRPFDAQKRLNVLRHALSLKKVPPGYFTEAELTDLCLSYRVNAAGIVNAVETAINRHTDKKVAVRNIKTILRNHERAILGPVTPKNDKSFDAYALECLNTSVELYGIIEIIKKNMGEYENADEGRRPSLSFLLYGPPGVGKTEFVRYLGHVLGKEVKLKRASDIQSMWVGEAEKNIAEAFSESRESGDILFFDEADTFLFPRSEAVRSWEKSFTNEILTQLENHHGLVIFATNDIDGLDHAALRRFRFKVRFDYLISEKSIRLYETMLHPLASDGRSLTTEEMDRIRNIRNLTPGDFAVVRNQYSLEDAGSVRHQAMISSLEKEVLYKKSVRRQIGFSM